VQVRAVCPSPPQLLHLLGDRFLYTPQTRSGERINQMTSLLPVAGFGAGAYLEKLFAGTRHRFPASTNAA
jgi:hypothetical protein